MKKMTEKELDKIEDRVNEKFEDFGKRTLSEISKLRKIKIYLNMVQKLTSN
tara:strand:+ start:1815 stop:1967 length:153 start_codon:yes stop_codon:yes gene_type:complete